MKRCKYFDPFCPCDDGECMCHYEGKDPMPVLAMNAQKIVAYAERLEAALHQCEDYFDSRADVRDGSDGSYGVPEPNAEMQILSEIRQALEQ